MNISLAFSDFPAPGHPFRIWCFLACGYLAPDGSFTRFINEAKVFPPDDFNSALEFVDKHVCDFFLKEFHHFADLGLFRPDVSVNRLSTGLLDVKIFIQFVSVPTLL